MTVERSKRRFLIPIVFITKRFIQGDIYPGQDSPRDLKRKKQPACTEALMACSQNLGFSVPVTKPMFFFYRAQLDKGGSAQANKTQ